MRIGAFTAKKQQKLGQAKIGVNTDWNMLNMAIARVAHFPWVCLGPKPDLVDQLRGVIFFCTRMVQSSDHEPRTMYCIMYYLLKHVVIYVNNQTTVYICIYRLSIFKCIHCIHRYVCIIYIYILYLTIICIYMYKHCLYTYIYTHYTTYMLMFAYIYRFVGELW